MCPPLRLDNLISILARPVSSPFDISRWRLGDACPKIRRKVHLFACPKSAGENISRWASFGSPWTDSRRDLFDTAARSRSISHRPRTSLSVGAAASRRRARRPRSRSATTTRSPTESLSQLSSAPSSSSGSRWRTGAHLPAYNFYLPTLHRIGDQPRPIGAADPGAPRSFQLLEGRYASARAART